MIGRFVRLLSALFAVVALTAASCGAAPPPTKTWKYVGKNSKGALTYELNPGMSTVCFQSRIDIEFGDQRDGVVKVTGLRLGDQVQTYNSGSPWTGGVVFKRGGRTVEFLPPGNLLDTRVAFRDQTQQNSRDICQFFGGRGDPHIRIR